MDDPMPKVRARMHQKHIEQMHDGQRQDGADHRVGRSAIEPAHEITGLDVILQSVKP